MHNKIFISTIVSVKTSDLENINLPKNITISYFKSHYRTIGFIRLSSENTTYIQYVLILFIQTSHFLQNITSKECIENGNST